MQRIGVFVCHCGTNIAATVDVKKVVDVISKEPGVVHAEDYQYMCSETGQQKVIDAIQNEHLTGVVICSCSPRMHEGTFRKAAEKAGLNPYQLEIANIREQCSWIHKDMEEEVVKTEIEDNDNNNLTIPQVVNRLGMVFFLLFFNLGNAVCRCYRNSNDQRNGSYDQSSIRCRCNRTDSVRISFRAEVLCKRSYDRRR